MVEVLLKNVTKRFGRVDAVKNVNLVFDEGRFTALLGPSGSGKSTLLYLIAGIYKPSEGRILFDGDDVTELMPNERNVGLVFQNYALYPHMTVFDNIAFPLMLRRVDREIIRARVIEVSRLLQIDDLLDRYPGQLSGGQQQRVALARALVKRPSVLLLDEPLSNLDALLRIKIRSELKKLQQELGITTIYVTHDQSEALAMADKVVVINKGIVQQEGSPHKIYKEPRNVFVASFIGSPPANIFKSSVDVSEDVCIVLPSKTSYCVHGSIARKILSLNLDEVIVAFRPEDAIISYRPLDDENKVVIVGEVYTVEPLGRESIITVKAEDEILKIITPPDVGFSSGDLVYVNINKDKIMLFDPETQINLKYIEA